MTIKTVKLGGTDWTDGEVLEAVDLNDTIESFPAIKKDISTVDASEYSGDYMAHDWTFTPGSECILLGVVAVGEFKTAESTNVLRIQIVTDSSNARDNGDTIGSLDYASTASATYESFSIKMHCAGGADITGNPEAESAGSPGLLLKESGTFTLRLIECARQSTTIKDVQWTVYWLDLSNMIVTTSSGKIA